VPDEVANVKKRGAHSRGVHARSRADGCTPLFRGRWRALNRYKTVPTDCMEDYRRKSAGTRQSAMSLLRAPECCANALVGFRALER